jgi:hypothetical protein
VALAAVLRTVVAAGGWLARPAQWFWRVLCWMPLVPPGFAGALYGLRHAGRAAFGLPYEHQPWPEVLAYESPKFEFEQCFRSISNTQTRARAAAIR